MLVRIPIFPGNLSWISSCMMFFDNGCFESLNTFQILMAAVVLIIELAVLCTNAAFTVRVKKENWKDINFSVTA